EGRHFGWGSGSGSGGRMGRGGGDVVHGILAGSRRKGAGELNRTGGVAVVVGMRTLQGGHSRARRHPFGNLWKAFGKTTPQIERAGFLVAQDKSLYSGMVEALRGS